MNQIPNQRSGREELAWLAEQYVLGELAQSDREAFEARLAEDQLAREALANAVALCAKVHSASRTTAWVAAKSQSTAAPHIRYATLTAVAAGLLLLAFAAQSYWNPSDSHGELAKAWSETREATLPDDSEPEPNFVAMDGVGGAIEDIDAPDWLMTAMTLSAEAGGDPKNPSEKANAGEGA